MSKSFCVLFQFHSTFCLRVQLTISIGCGYGLVPKRRQAITGINDYPIYGRIHASPSFNESVQSGILHWISTHQYHMIALYFVPETCYHSECAGLLFEPKLYRPHRKRLSSFIKEWHLCHCIYIWITYLRKSNLLSPPNIRKNGANWKTLRQILNDTFMSLYYRSKHFKRVLKWSQVLWKCQKVWNKRYWKTFTCFRVNFRTFFWTPDITCDTSLYFLTNANVQPTPVSIIRKTMHVNQFYRNISLHGAYWL